MVYIVLKVSPVRPLFIPLLSLYCLLSLQLKYSHHRASQCWSHWVSSKLFQSQHTNHHASPMKWKKSAWKIPMLCWSKSLSNVTQLWWGAVGGGALHLDQYHRQLPNNWKKCVLTNTSEPELYSSPNDCLLSQMFSRSSSQAKKTS